MNIAGSVALVTGANRGLGAAFVRALIAKGARKVYAASRTEMSVTAPGVVPVTLDVNNPQQIQALAAELKDVTLLINNAGVFEAGPVLSPGSVDALMRQLETNALGPLRLVQAFAPNLAAAGGGAVVNVLSVLSWLAMPHVSGTYSASKSAAWALSNAMRHELMSQGTHVLSVHAAFIDTDMAKGVQMPKNAPDDVAKKTLEALEAVEREALIDEVTRNVHAGLTATPPVYLGKPS